MAYYVGIGLPDHNEKFPFLKEDLDLLRDSITTILCTCQGQRLFDPEFGSRLCHLLFEPNDPTLQVIAEEVIREAITRWEPRVRLTGVMATSTEHTLKLNISLVEIKLNIPFNLPITITRDRNREL